MRSGPGSTPGRRKSNARLWPRSSGSECRSRRGAASVGAHQEIREMIVRDLHFTGSRSELTDSYGLLDNAVIDSMGIFKLVGLLEERYVIEIDEEDMVAENFET